MFILASGMRDSFNIDGWVPENRKSHVTDHGRYAENQEPVGIGINVMTGAGWRQGLRQK